jgi:hypothetical protein
MDFLTGTNLLDFPENTLLNDILPKVPLDELNKFCLLSPQNNALCKRDELWIAKIEYEYPVFVNLKPTNMSWSNYYVYLTRRRSIPVYVNGLTVGNVMFSSELFNMTLNDLLNNYIAPYYIIFTDEHNKPYILIREPNNVITILSEKYDEISKIVISQS